ncbi:hypothetical protein DM02DRAFT_633995 [Periconia macrospinosa]|uniref:Uncharacterized protein n=1 Tax=Periconia macrospinosa TaxID=97972 RepID=A0A2V1D7S0_9PLEO|nr:hypothetical protein DM02DRAFT_633995 [Periconia macrospinosa]
MSYHTPPKWPPEDFPLFDEEDEENKAMEDVEGDEGDENVAKAQATRDIAKYSSIGEQSEDVKMGDYTKDQESESDDEKIRLKPKARLQLWADKQWEVFSGIDGQVIEIKDMIRKGQAMDDAMIRDRKQIVEELLSRIPHIEKKFYKVLPEDLSKIQKSFKRFEQHFQEALRATFDRSMEVQKLLGCEPFENQMNEDNIHWPARYHKALEEWRRLPSFDPTKIHSSETADHSGTSTPPS